MIRSFSIRNFKAFQELTIQLNQLVLLSGVNSSGKSSVLQALRLAELAAAGGSTVQLNDLMGLELGEANGRAQPPRRSSRTSEFVVQTDKGTDSVRANRPC